jgi:hypothetical protein
MVVVLEQEQACRQILLRLRVQALMFQSLNCYQSLLMTLKVCFQTRLRQSYLRLVLENRSSQTVRRILT